jgi:uncharacterized ion transporter superfamily protein YfcC
MGATTKVKFQQEKVRWYSIIKKDTTTYRFNSIVCIGIIFLACCSCEHRCVNHVSNRVELLLLVEGRTFPREKDRHTQ